MGGLGVTSTLVSSWMTSNSAVSFGEEAFYILQPTFTIKDRFYVWGKPIICFLHNNWMKR